MFAVLEVRFKGAWPARSSPLRRGNDTALDLICNSTFNAILKLSIDFNKPIGNGIITALNMKQAINRSQKNSTNKPNKGSEAANAVMSILKNEPKKI